MSRLLRKPVTVIAAIVAAVIIPFVITAIKLASPRPYVVLDLAQTEMRVRNVFSAHPPLIGLPGRLGIFGVHTGSHPGPLSFYVLAPFYKLFGSDPWALFAGALSVNLIWVGLALWLGWRRGGLRMCIAVGAVVLVLIHTFGIIVVEQPWNPYMPLMAWTVVLLAAWSVLCDDVAMLPVLVFAASYCMQTHLPYLGMGGGIVAGTVVVMVVWAAWRRRIDRSGVARPTHRLGWLMGTDAGRPGLRRVAGWTGVAAVVGGLVWLPPVYQQLRWGADGNLNLIWDDLAHPPQAAGGISQGVHLVLAHLDVVKLFSGHRIEFVVINSNWSGVIMLAVWLISVVVAWRYRVRALVILDAVIAAALVLAVAALSKIYGDLYWYLMMWMWTICAAMVATIVWSVIEVVRQAELSAVSLRRVRVPAQAVLGLGMVALFISLTVGATRADIPDRNLSDQMAQVTPPTIAAINAGRMPGDTGKGRVLVTWMDPVKIGSAGYTLFDELNGDGIPAGMRPIFWGIITKRQIVPVGTERGVVHLSVGDTDISKWRATPSAVEVAFYDGRTAAEKKKFARLRDKARRLIREAGKDPSVVDSSLTGASLDTSLPLEATQAMSHMADIGLPVAVFLAPPGS